MDPLSQRFSLWAVPNHLINFAQSQNRQRMGESQSIYTSLYTSTSERRHLIYCCLTLSVERNRMSSLYTMISGVDRSKELEWNSSD